MPKSSQSAWQNYSVKLPRIFFLKTCKGNAIEEKYLILFHHIHYRQSLTCTIWLYETETIPLLDYRITKLFKFILKWCLEVPTHKHVAYNHIFNYSPLSKNKLTLNMETIVCQNVKK